VSPGIFPVESDSSMCPVVDSASKNEYQDNPGGKDGRCVRLTTYHLLVPIVKKSGGLNHLEPCGPLQASNETALSFYLYMWTECEIFSVKSGVTYGDHWTLSCPVIICSDINLLLF